MFTGDDEFPLGWPVTIPLPSREERERAVREGEADLRRNLEQMRKKQRQGISEFAYLGPVGFSSRVPIPTELTMEERYPFSFMQITQDTLDALREKIALWDAEC